MLPLAEACDFNSGSFAEYEGRLNKWDDAERAEIMAELDAAFFHLYGIGRDEQPLLHGASTAQRIVQKFAEMSIPA